VERRLAITYIVSATTTFGIACVAIATASGGLFASAEPKPAPGKQEIVDDYIVVHSSTTVLAADAADPGAVDPRPKSALTRAPLPAAAATAAPALAPPEAVTADAPLSETPPTAAPASAKVPDEAPAPAPSFESDDEPVPAPAPAATSEPAAPASGPAARPPVPPGCHDPEFSHGTWKCDDD
jgi:hypothetical protein